MPNIVKQKTMFWSGIALGCFAVLFMAAFFFAASPRHAVADMQKAVEENDLQAIDQKVDFMAIQEDVPFLAQQLASREDSMRKGPVLHQMTIEVAKDELRQYTTAQGLDRALSGEEPGLLGSYQSMGSNPIPIHRTSLTTFTARIPGSMGLEYELRGFSWKITGIEMPERGTRNLL